MNNIYKRFRFIWLLILINVILKIIVERSLIEFRNKNNFKSRYSIINKVEDLKSIKIAVNNMIASCIRCNFEVKTFVSFNQWYRRIFKKFWASRIDLIFSRSMSWYSWVRSFLMNWIFKLIIIQSTCLSENINHFEVLQDLWIHAFTFSSLIKLT